MKAKKNDDSYRNMEAIAMMVGGIDGKVLNAG